MDQLCYEVWGQGWGAQTVTKQGLVRRLLLMHDVCRLASKSKAVFSRHHLGIIDPPVVAANIGW